MTRIPQLTSDRLEYRPLAPEHLDGFHTLVLDDHVRRYLLDGEVMPRDWSAAEIPRSQGLFETLGVGLWMVFESGRAAPIGFCGYRVFPELGDDAQLLYAFAEPYIGRGYATEVGRALVDYARAHTAMDPIVSAVDAPNTASIRVLEKLGFRPTGEVPGAFGVTVMFELAR